MAASRPGFTFLKMALYHATEKRNWFTRLGEKECVSSSWPS